FSYRHLQLERLDERSMLAGDLTSSTINSIYWNQVKPTDVNADGVVTALDALTVINSINAKGSRLLTGEVPPPFLDVNNDGYVSAVDVVLVINQLNAKSIQEASVPVESVAIPTIALSVSPASIQALPDGS